MISPAEFASVANEVIRDVAGIEPALPEPFVAHALRHGVAVELIFTSETAEWFLQIAQEGQADPPFNLSDLLRITNCPEERWRPLVSLVTQDAEVACRVLVGAAEALQVFGAAYLAGERSAFAAARQTRSERAAAYTASINQAPAIELARLAWEGGDLATVVEALTPFRGSLPVDQDRRLAIAERRLAESGSDG